MHCKFYIYNVGHLNDQNHQTVVKCIFPVDVVVLHWNNICQHLLLRGGIKCYWPQIHISKTTHFPNNMPGIQVKGKLVETFFSASRGAHLLFTIAIGPKLLNISCCCMCEGRQLSAQQACDLPSLSRNSFIHLGRVEQVRVKCLAQGYKASPT